MKNEDCYLCGKPLNQPTTPDHIIPVSLFIKGDPHRPKLIVHDKCNNLKSKEDEWFVRQLQIRSAFNPEVEKEFSKMMDKALSEKKDAYIIGKKLHSYKLAKTLFDKVIWGLEIKHKGQSLKQMKISKEDVNRFNKYVETMARGLFIKNVEGARPAVPDLILKQYADLELRGQQDGFIESIKQFIDGSTRTRFGQMWGDRISYIGSRVQETPNKGFVFIQFYTQFCVLATFV